MLQVGCANKGGYVQFHEGPPLPPNKKAIIEGHYGYRNGSIANEMTRIVEINGERVPKQWFVAEGANTVSLLPGYYEIKILYVHGFNIIDYYTYITLPVVLEPNCTYKIITEWSSSSTSVGVDLVSKPSSEGSDATCAERAIQPEPEQGPINI